MSIPSKIFYTSNELKEAIEYHLNQKVFRKTIIVISVKFVNNGIEVILKGELDENNVD